MHKKFLLTLLSLFLLLGVTTSKANESSENELKILFIGDSLTEGYGISKEDSYPSVFQKMASDHLKKPVKVMNGSVSGSTSASGLGRLKWYLKAKPDWLILALGANDGLRGLEVKSTKKNLEKVIKTALEKNIKVVLAGMLMPKNYGEKYRENFSQLYKELSNDYAIELIPFLLEGVAMNKDLNQADGIHPNEKGHQAMAQNLWTFMKPHLVKKSPADE